LLSIIGGELRAEGKTTKGEPLLAEAERALRKAVELKPDVPETWVAIIQFFSLFDKQAEAEKSVKEAAKKIPAKQVHLALAQCYADMKQPDAAEGEYKAALAAAPEDPSVVRSVADYYCRMGNPLPAEAQLQRIIDGKVKAPEADVMWARRQLALILAARDDYQSIQKARNLIEANLAASETSLADRRVMINLNAVDPNRSNRDKAISTLESMLGEQSATPEDRYKLAQMYRAAGWWGKANTAFLKLVSSYPNEPSFLATYVAALLEHGETANAEGYLDRLAQLVPNHIVPVGLRAEMLAARNEPERALDLLKEFVDNPNAQPPEWGPRIRMVAEKLEKIGRQLTKPDQKMIAEQFVSRAERQYRAYVDQNPGQESVLVSFLGRQGRIDEALELLNRTWDSNNPVVLQQVTANILLSEKIDNEQLARLDSILQKAIKQFDRPVPLLMVLADLRIRQTRYDAANDLFREVIKKNSGNANAMNNLAVLLALQGINLDEAFKLINQAIDIAGPVGAMLDSRASVYIAMHQPDKALTDLVEAVKDAEVPIRLFHQAQAYEASGQHDSAVAAMKSAVNKGLTKEKLLKLELPTFEKLQKSLR
jgi:tetratricopeptide (TPR) repeat protein